MIDAAHRLHPLRCQADFVTGNPVGAHDIADIDLLNLICRRKIGNTFKGMKGLSVTMFRRNQFGGGCDAGGHVFSSGTRTADRQLLRTLEYRNFYRGRHLPAAKALLKMLNQRQRYILAPWRYRKRPFEHRGNLICSDALQERTRAGTAIAATDIEVDRAGFCRVRWPAFFHLDPSIRECLRGIADSGGDFLCRCGDAIVIEIGSAGIRTLPPASVPRPSGERPGSTINEIVTLGRGRKLRHISLPKDDAAGCA